MESMATLGIAALRLRHPLRPRPVPPGDRRRLAGRACPRTGCRSAIPGSSSGRRSRYAIGFGGTVETRDRRGRQRRATSGTRPRRSTRSPTTRRSPAGAARHVNTLRLWSARAADPLRLDALQPRRPRRRARRAGRARRAISRVLYPSDDTAAGQELRLRQEYFFTSRLAAGPPAPPPAAARRPRVAAGPRGDPAQRHASGDRGRRADAAPGRRARRSPGSEAWRDHARAASPTPTTRCCRRRWRAGRWR